MVNLPQQEYNSRIKNLIKKLYIPMKDSMGEIVIIKTRKAGFFAHFSDTCQQ